MTLFPFFSYVNLGDYWFDMLLLVSFAASCLHFSRKHLENKTAVLESRLFLTCFHLFTVSFLFHYRFQPRSFLSVLWLNEHRCFRQYCWPPLPPHRLGSISLIFFSVPLIKGITLALSLSFSFFLRLRHFDFNWSVWTNPALLVTFFCVCSSS